MYRSSLSPSAFVFTMNFEMSHLIHVPSIERYPRTHSCLPYFRSRQTFLNRMSKRRPLALDNDRIKLQLHEEQQDTSAGRIDKYERVVQRYQRDFQVCERNVSISKQRDSFRHAWQRSRCSTAVWRWRCPLHPWEIGRETSSRPQDV